jgi:UDP-N-acetyl-D-mannosaminuronic acid transferase (WecB/TagA/CpsF family)
MDRHDCNLVTGENAGKSACAALPWPINIPSGMDDDFRTILGIRFFAGTAEEAVRLGMRGGLVVAPSAPVLVTMVDDADTRDALQRSRLALTDSGLMVLLWNFLRRDHVGRVSGLEYLELMLRAPSLREPDASFWIMPNEEALERCLAWLQAQGHPATRENFYLAPVYGAGTLRDEKLLAAISSRRPKQVFLAIGGGVQERLGLYLQENISSPPGIHCIGAAIGFLTGDQVRIPMWADRWRIGWFIRILSAPERFGPRYWNARRLIPLLLKYGERSPVEEDAGRD